MSETIEVSIWGLEEACDVIGTTPKAILNSEEDAITVDMVVNEILDASGFEGSEERETAAAKIWKDLSEACDTYEYLQGQGLPITIRFTPNKGALS